MTGTQGWYPTGDIGQLDAEANLYCKGRKKDVIVTPAGMNIYPEDLEAALLRQPEVKLCVVIPLPRNGNAEPCAVMILRDGGLDPAPIVKRVNESLAEYQRINSWFVWPEEDFPRTSTQKPRINLIQQTVQARMTNKASGQAIAGPLRELIARVSHLTGSELSPQANLESDLNLS